MGLFFNKKTANGAINRHNVASSNLSSKGIKDAVAKMGFSSDADAKAVRDGILRAREGGLKDKEVFDAVQKGVQTGRFTREKGREALRRAGVNDWMAKKLKDMSESRESGKKNPEEARREFARGNSANEKEVDKAATAEQKSPVASGKASSSMKLSSGYSNMQFGEKNDSSIEVPKKPGSIWDILNKRKN